MARYIEHKRDTELFVAGSLETPLPQNAMARTIRAALDRLGFSGFDPLYSNDEGGRPALDPRSLTAVWILALVRGVSSSVRLAGLCGQDIEFRWLLGDAGVEKRTLCDFRKAHRAQISALGSQVLVALGHSGLLPGKNLGVDGAIVREASSRHSVKTRKGLSKQLERVETLLRERLSEDNEGSTQHTEAMAHHQRKVAQALERMGALGLTGDKDRLTVTEPSARLLRQKNGSYAPGYNIQAVPDLDSGAIIHAEAVEAGSDGGQLQPQIEQARAVLEQIGVGGPADRAPNAAADGAYHDTHQLLQKAKEGRSVSRSLHTELLDTVAQRVASEQGNQMKRARWIACEGAFARLNGLLHWTRCRLWDWDGVRAELAWRQLAHNLMLLTGLWKPLVPQCNTA